MEYAIEMPAAENRARIKCQTSQLSSNADKAFGPIAVHFLEPLVQRETSTQDVRQGHSVIFGLSCKM